ncbi:YedE-related selenium metabolism membrane protein [Acidaminobacter sp. JC074]|uniref:YedE family putative selenium transporter n=1 Tax=Acidaminobacter sp. JC074 TaxID=2530199 RepID=UPI001F109265|nr:YedE family putative selenium transporter [Acidaminobacter sp. JC074]MCH4889941.1 YedE-related selenium metabolism membrane protein [Acidaminobacter sp. JC074]
MKNRKLMIVLGGLIIGVLSGLLVKFGNLGNMGVCIACFLRDISGSLGLHSTSKLAYIRPEIIGIVLGAFIAAFVAKEFNVKGGSSPFIRFLLGMTVMIGALAFLGCPMRMVLRLAGGDLNAILGIAGFSAGILVGIFFLNKGFTLKRNYDQPKAGGYMLVAIMVALLVALLARPAFLIFGVDGKLPPAAPIALSLTAGLVAGVVAQKTRLCMVGGIRDIILFKDNYLLLGFLSILLGAFVTNLAFGNFNIGFEGQPAAHNVWYINFVGMFVAGWGSVLLGGCPLRQLILSSEGNVDSSVTIMGLMMGAGVAHNLKLVAASPNTMPALVILTVFLLFVSLVNREVV